MEQHLLIDWGRHIPVDDMKSFISRHGLECHQVIPMDAFKNPRSVLQKMYGQPVHEGRASRYHSIRGTTPFYMYLIHDQDAVYDTRRTYKGYRIVNIKMYDLKTELRAQTQMGTQAIHATDNIQETKDNLRVLNMYGSHYRPTTFANIREVFDALNADPKLTYVVMRNFEGLPDHMTVDEHLDVDILCNDYYRAKRILDGDSVIPTPRYEDGGYRILNYVRVGGTKVMFDLRYVGDQYYDRPLEERMLERRVPWHNVYVPDPETHLYTLIYHAIIHKHSISETYKRVCREHDIPEDDMTRPKLLQKIATYMKENGYVFVRPLDHSVAYVLSAAEATQFLDTISNGCE
jgi:hypothetical protein